MKLIESLSDEPVIVSAQMTVTVVGVTMPVPLNEPSGATVTVKSCFHTLSNWCSVSFG